MCLGLWDYELIDRKVINVYYDVLFYVMLKKEKLVKYLYDILIRYILYMVSLTIPDKRDNLKKCRVKDILFHIFSYIWRYHVCY